MANIDRIKKCQEYLNTEQYDTKLYTSPQNHHVPFLVINLGKGNDNHERLLTLKCEEQMMGETLLPKNQSKGDSTLLHYNFKIEYPFKFEPETTKELASLLHFINHQCEVTGFCMDEVEHRIYYRYQMFSLEGGVDRKVLISTVGMIMFFFDLYINAIEQIAKGSMTFNELIAQILLLAKENSNINKVKR